MVKPNLEFKSAIKHSLQIHHWEIVEVGNLQEWWEEENWKIQWRHRGGLTLYIQFLVDPQDASRIWEVTAITQLSDDKRIVASLPMSKRKFSIKLKEFVLRIEEFRKENY